MSVIEILAENLLDPQLALVVARLKEGRSLICIKKYFMTSFAEWIERRRPMSCKSFELFARRIL